VRREIEHDVDHSRDQLLRVGLADTGLPSTDPMSEIAGFDVLFDPLAAGLPGIVADARVDSSFPEFRGQPRGQGVRARPSHLLVHPGELLNR